MLIFFSHSLYKISNIFKWKKVDPKDADPKASLPLKIDERKFRFF